MVEYFLPPHVYFGCRGDAVVFLDLKQDDYLLVNGDTAAAFRALSSQKQAREPTLELSGMLEGLLKSGLLTTDPSTGKNIAATKIELALECLVGPDTPPTVHATPNHAWRFIVACIVAAMRLTWQHLEDVVKVAEERKARRTFQPVDIARARELTAIFQKLRYFFPMNYLCLYDSLALLEFLARYQIFPTWVFGVKLEPWAAHCWLQEAGLLFNEDAEAAANYTPIMAI